MMHLDTVFTQVDYDKFTVHNGLADVLQVYKITKGQREDELKISQIDQSLEKILCDALKKIKLS